MNDPSCISIPRREFVRQSMAAVGIAATPTRNALPQETEQRAERVHNNSTAIVMHDHNPILPDVPRMLAGGVTGKVYQVGLDVTPEGRFRESAAVRDGWKDKTLAAVEEARRQVASRPDQLLLALQAADFVKAKQQGKVAVMFGVEGGKLLEGSLEALRHFYEKGLRELQLRWAVPNQIVEQDSLTPFGVKVVRECHRLGIIVDLTHIPERAYYEVMELAEKPPIVSHGTAAGAPRGRDMSDRRLQALAERGGVLGIHFYSSYLGPKPDVKRVVEQVDYIAELVGIETAGLGVDFFPTTGGWRDFQIGQGTREISWAVPHIGHMDRVTEALAARNYSDDDIKRVLGGNFLRVCREVFGG